MDLFNDNIGLVSLFVERLDYGYVEKEDMFQAGLMGLFEATKKYNVNSSTKFSSFASYYIMGAIKKELRENRLIKYNKEICKVKREIANQDYNCNVEILREKTNVSENIIKDVYLNSLEIVKYDEVLVDTIKEKENSIFKYMKESLEGVFYDIIKKRYIDNLSQTEISLELNISQSKVSRIEKIGLKKLKNYYIDYKH